MHLLLSAQIRQYALTCNPAWLLSLLLYFLFCVLRARFHNKYSLNYTLKHSIVALEFKIRSLKRLICIAALKARYVNEGVNWAISNVNELFACDSACWRLMMWNGRVQNETRYIWSGVESTIITPRCWIFNSYTYTSIDKIPELYFITAATKKHHCLLILLLIYQPQKDERLSWPEWIAS